MKKVLVLAYDFPPLISIGAQRPYSWYRYFAEQGYQVTVVTRKWPASTNRQEDYVKPTEAGDSIEGDDEGLRTVIRTAYKPNMRDKMLLHFGLNRFVIIRKILSFIYAISEHLFLAFDSKQAIYHAADIYLKEHKVDYIIATGEPFILFKYASVLSKKYSTPWVADYRDGWTNNQGGYRNTKLDKLLNKFQQGREQKYIANAVLITTAAPAYKEQLQKIHPTKKVEVVFNGYFEEYYDSLQVEEANEKFIISYAGTIYSYQRIDMFMQGFNTLLSKLPNANIELRFYGLNAGLKESITDMAGGNVGYIHFFNKITTAELAKELAVSNINLLLSAKYVNTLASKVFDYMAVRKPILLVENDFGILAEILRECNAGQAIENSDELANVLMKHYNDFMQNEGRHVWVNSDNVQKYSRRAQAKVFVSLLNTCKL